VSLADLVPAVLATRMERRKIGRAVVQRRYKERNRAKLNAYRRKWHAQRKAA
jgi:hypothetical protein